MNINGKNGLACLTNLKTLKDPIVLKPLPGPHRGFLSSPFHTVCSNGVTVHQQPWF